MSLEDRPSALRPLRLGLIQNIMLLVAGYVLLVFGS